MESVAGGASGVEIARRVGFDQSAVSRWKKGERPGIEFVIRFARAYDRNVLEALVEAGCITEAEAGLRDVPAEPSGLTSEQMLTEMLRRARE